MNLFDLQQALQRAVVGMWLGSFLLGFHFREKLPANIKAFLRKVMRRTIMVPMIGAGTVGVAMLASDNGCGGAAKTAQSASVDLSIPKPMLVTKLVDPPRVQRRLKVIEAEQKAEQRMMRQKLLKLQQNLDQPSGLFKVKVASYQKAGTRKGPFCRVTCLVHHGSTYDVEALPEYCQASWIPPETVWVPGWITTATGDYEYLNPWPGPANPSGGFDSYKLYWK